jgi:hypothetical protein
MSKMIRVPDPLFAWLAKVQEEQSAQLGRTVTMAEVLERLLAIHRPVSP